MERKRTVCDRNPSKPVASQGTWPSGAEVRAGLPAIPYLVFKTLARTMAADAQQHKELLIKHGLGGAGSPESRRAAGQFHQAMGM
jgi:hypothetical protein